MTDQRLSLAQWQEHRRAICAGIAAAGQDEERLLALARELVDWEGVRPTSNVDQLQRVLEVSFDGCDVSSELNHLTLVQMTDRQIARLLWELERISVCIWQCYTPRRG